MEEAVDEVLEVEINGKTYRLDMNGFAERMVIDPDNLDYELEHQAAFFVWIATLATNAEFLYEEAKQSFDLFYAELVNDSRLSFEKGGAKAPAATVIEAKAKQDPEYPERLAEMKELQRIAAIFKTLRDAVHMRQFTLIERSKRLSRDAAAEYTSED